MSGILRRDVTVVVPTKNERANAGAFLASLPPDVALVVVDASDDGTPERVLALRPKRTLVLRDRGNIPRARQIGAEAARTPWCLFTDADVALAPDYFDRLEALRLPERTGGVVGTKRTRGPYRLYHRLFREGQRLLAAFDVPAATGSNMLIAREALAACGGFDVGLSCNEDSEVMWRVKRSGYQVAFAPELRVIARDHRRLERGVTRKLVHSTLRCALLYSGLLPRRMREHDFGYWSTPAHTPEKP